jgi:hypothetical protein
MVSLQILGFSVACCSLCGMFLVSYKFLGGLVLHVIRYVLDVSGFPTNFRV